MFPTFSPTIYWKVFHCYREHISLIQDRNFVEIEYSSKERSLKSRWMFFLVRYT
jgi:hypothetical protein